MTRGIVWKLGWLALLLAALTACGAPGAGEAQPSQLPFAERDFAALLVQDGDLPARLRAEAAPERAAFLAALPSAAREVDLRLVDDNGERGSITLFVFEPTTDVAVAYVPLSDVLEAAAQRPPQFISSIGQRSGVVMTSPPGSPPRYDLSFFRCQAAVYLRLETDTLDDLLQYARRLDQRLRTAACP